MSQEFEPPKDPSSEKDYQGAEIQESSDPLDALGPKGHKGPSNSSSGQRLRRPRRRSAQLITTRDVWRRAFFIVHHTRAALWPLVVLGMMVPQIIFIFLFDFKAAPIVATVRQQANAQSGNFDDTLQTAYSFLGPYMLVALALWMLFLASYMGLVHMAVHFERTSSVLSVRDSLRRGLQSALSSGFALILILLFLGFVGQLLIAPAVIVSTLCLVVPVVMVAERRGAFTALREAVTLRYLRQKRGAAALSGWNVTFILMVLGCFFYACVSLLSLGSQTLLELDRYVNLPRSIWTMTFSGFSFGPVYMLATLLELVLSFAVVALVPSMTTAVYFLAAGKKDLARA
jgi:hypothetical protein